MSPWRLSRVENLSLPIRLSQYTVYFKVGYYPVYCLIFWYGNINLYVYGNTMLTDRSCQGTTFPNIGSSFWYVGSTPQPRRKIQTHSGEILRVYFFSGLLCKESCVGTIRCVLIKTVFENLQFKILVPIRSFYSSDPIILWLYKSSCL